MKYIITTIHGDNYHNIARFVTNKKGYKAFLSMLKNDITKSFPFRVVELNSEKEIYLSKGWSVAYKIHLKIGCKQKDIHCDFCCGAIPKQ